MINSIAYTSCVLMFVPVPVPAGCEYMISTRTTKGSERSQSVLCIRPPKTAKRTCLWPFLLSTRRRHRFRRRSERKGRNRADRRRGVERCRLRVPKRVVLTMEDALECIGVFAKGHRWWRWRWTRRATESNAYDEVQINLLRLTLCTRVISDEYAEPPSLKVPFKSLSAFEHIM
jgi:hypothetical protein